MKIVAPTIGQQHGPWVCIGGEPYTNRAGEVVTLYLWRRPCRVCGLLFTVKTTANYSRFKVFELVHCEAHRGVKAQEFANTQKPARTARRGAGAVHGERAKNCCTNCTTTAPRCTTVQGEAGVLHPQLHHSQGPSVSWARCGAVVQPDAGFGAVHLEAERAKNPGPGEPAEIRTFNEPAEICAEGWTC